MRNILVIKNGEQYINEAISNNDVDFIVAFAQTPWHVLSIEATIDYLRNEKAVGFGFVTITSHPTTGMAIQTSAYLSDNICVCIPPNESNTDENKSHRKICPSGYIKRIIRNRINHISYYWFLLTGWKRKKGRIIYVISPAFPASQLGWQIYKKGCNPIFVISDEGIGTFLPSFEYSLAELKKAYGPRGYLVYFRNVIMSHKWVKLVFPIIDACLFVKDKETLRLNEPLKNSYLRAMQKRISFIDTSLYPDLTSKVLFCTTLYEDNFELEEYKKVENSIINCFIEAGLKIVIKPHPRDNNPLIRSSEKVEYFNTKGIDAESICLNSRPICIIGYASTALATVGSLLKIPAICLTDLLDPKKLREEHLNNYKRIKHLCGQIVHYPQSINQLVSIINHYVN